MRKEEEEDIYENMDRLSNIYSDDELISPDISPIMIEESEEEHMFMEEVTHVPVSLTQKSSKQGPSCASNTSAKPFHFIPNSFASADQITAFLVVEQPSWCYQRFGPNGCGSAGLASLDQYLEKEEGEGEGPYCLIATRARQLIKFQNGQLQSCCSLPYIASSVYVCSFVYSLCCIDALN